LEQSFLKVLPCQTGRLRSGKTKSSIPKVPSSFITLMDTVTIQKQPYGVVLIISPWNFPFILSFQPLIGAIAAGNSVLLKPSELTPACSQLIAELIPKYLDKVSLMKSQSLYPRRKHIPKTLVLFCETSLIVVSILIVQTVAATLTW
uniref:Aldedh domain-containing protein n=1 Tax=Schistosoma curassoni TaxID=6186 RepID=A0A183JKB0_9TREM